MGILAGTSAGSLGFWSYRRSRNYVRLLLKTIPLRVRSPLPGPVFFRAFYCAFFNVSKTICSSVPGSWGISINCQPSSFPFGWLSP
jgi:hypothetical protein